MYLGLSILLLPLPSIQAHHLKSSRLSYVSVPVWPGNFQLLKGDPFITGKAKRIGVLGG